MVDPLELLRAEKEVEEAHGAILGFYHSHPNHPAEPSEFDRSHAVPWYRWHVILSIQDREPEGLRAWAFDGEASTFRPEPLSIE